MLNIFKPSSETDKLKKKHSKLLKQAYKLSHTDRKGSDALYAEADKLANEIDLREKKG